MKNIDEANALVFKTIESLIELQQTINAEKETNHISLMIDDLEEVRHLLCQIRNDIYNRFS